MSWNNNEITKLRTILNLTQAEFADRLGCSKRSVIRWENGTKPSRKAETALDTLIQELSIQQRQQVKPIWYYPTNDWGEFKWVKVQSWKNGKRSRWSWYLVDKVSMFHETCNHILVFQTIGHFAEQDKMSNQISNLSFDWDVGGDDWLKNFERCRVSVELTIESFLDLGLEEHEIRVWFSGGRSYHVEIPYQCLGIEPCPELNKLMKQLALDVNSFIIDQAGFYALEIDETLYANPKMYRTPNSIYPPKKDYPPHTTHKIELTHQQVQEIETIDELWELAREPKPPLYDTDIFATYEPKPSAVEWYQEIKDMNFTEIGRIHNPAVEWYQEIKEQFEETQKNNTDVHISKEAIENMDGIPSCIADLRTNGIKKNDTRNQATLFDAVYCKLSGVEQNDALNIIDAWVQKIPDSLSDTPRGRKRTAATRSVVHSVYESDDYKDFYCGTAKKLGLKCDYNACPIHRKYDLRKHNKKIQKVENIQLPDRNIHIVDTIEEAREYIEEKIAESIDNRQNAIFTPPPGIGKTTTGVRAAEQILPRIIYAGPRHENCDYVFQEVAQKDNWTQILPRRPLGKEPKKRDKQAHAEWEASALCPMWRKADRLASLRYNVGGILCAEGMPNWCGNPKGVCLWWQQFITNKSATLTHAYLFNPTLIDLLIGEKIPKADNIITPVVLLDEPSPDAFLEKIFITTDIINKTIKKNPNGCIRELLQLIRKLIEDNLSNGDPKPIFGSGIMKAMVETYNGNFEDLMFHIKETVEHTDFVDIEADSLINGTDKAYQVSCNGKTVWIPKEWEVIVSSERLLFRVPPSFAEDNELIPATDIEEDDDEESGLTLQFVDDLLKVITVEYEKYKEGKPYNSALAIQKVQTAPNRKKEGCLVMRLRNPLQIPGDIPLLAFDANADVKLIEHLTRRKLEKYHVDVKMDCRIVQILDGKYGITTLLDKDGIKPKSSFFRLVNTIKLIAQDKGAEWIFLNTWKAIEEILRDMQKKGDFPKEILINHFGNIRGSTAYENRDIGIIFGAPCPSPDDMMMSTQALYWDEEYVNAELEEVWEQY
ncbi:MAG: hypothetical protein DRZ76_02715, partial [Candidatus Nealsonbacteria bacterium]